MKTVHYAGVDGSMWDLSSVAHQGVFLSRNPVDLAADESGVVSGSLELVVADNDPDGRRMDGIEVTMRRWRQAWSLRRDGWLQVRAEGSWEAVLRVRLAAVVPSLPEDDPRGYVEFSQQVTSDPARRSWWTRTRDYRGGQVSPVNTGDVEAWARVRWEQAGTLVQPSGARVVLPAVDSPRTIWLDPQESCLVVDDRGVRDDALWRRLRGVCFPEPIPAGEQRTFGLPPGAALLVDERVDDPWL